MFRYPVFIVLRHVSYGLVMHLTALFFALAYLSEFHIEKPLLDSAHDAYPVYEYCRR